MKEPFKDDRKTQNAIDKAGKYINDSLKEDLTKDQLIDIDRNLSGWHTFLQVQAALYQGDMNDDYWHRSVEYSKAAIKERHTKMAQNKADHLAKTEVIYEIEQQNLSCLQFEYLKRFCLGIGRVIDSVNTRLRWLEKEYKFQKNQT